MGWEIVTRTIKGTGVQTHSHYKDGELQSVQLTDPDAFHDWAIGMFEKLEQAEIESAKVKAAWEDAELRAEKAEARVAELEAELKRSNDYIERVGL